MLYITTGYIFGSVMLRAMLRQAQDNHLQTFGRLLTQGVDDPLAKKCVIDATNAHKKLYDGISSTSINHAMESVKWI